MRPELNQRQVKAVANVIAADVRPDATTVDPEDVRRTQAAVEDAIVRQQPAGARAVLR
jgi:mono/diheme cytochrome c family protein